MRGVFISIKEAVVDFLNVFISEASRFSVTLSVFLIFLGLFYWYSVYPFSVFSRCGIKHPKPVPFFGNIFIFLPDTWLSMWMVDLICRPVVVVADLDMLRQVMVKDFSSFPNKMMRTLIKSIPFATKPMTDCLFLLKKECWKRVRSIGTPSFSAAKLKEMVLLINTATDALMNNLNVHAESGEPFDIHRCFGCFTIDVWICKNHKKRQRSR